MMEDRFRSGLADVARRVGLDPDQVDMAAVLSRVDRYATERAELFGLLWLLAYDLHPAGQCRIVGADGDGPDEAVEALLAHMEQTLAAATVGDEGALGRFTEALRGRWLAGDPS